MASLHALTAAITAGAMLAASISMAAAPEPAPASDTIHRIEIRAKPALFGLMGALPLRLGKLVDRGTFSLKSADKDFGGLSALLVSTDGARFLAISD